MNALGPLPASSTLTAEPAVRVNARTGHNTLLSVAALASGGHAVAWLSQEAGNANVHMRRFDAHGQPMGSDLQAGVDTLDADPAAAVLSSGAMVIAAVDSGPASVDEPWVTRSAIRVQRFEASGQAGADIDVGVVEQNRIGAATMRYVTDPAIVHWEDGSFLVAWALVEEDAGGRRPQFWVQRFDAAGQRVGAAGLAAAGEPNSGFRVTASPSGGWVLTTFHLDRGRALQRYHSFEGAAAPALPPGSTGLAAEGSLLLPLYGGAMALLSPAKVYGAVQLYGGNGQPMAAAYLPSVPVAGAALRDGGFVVFHGGASGLVGQRFDAGGQLVGQPTPVDAASDLRAAALAGGGLAIGWTAAGAGGADVMSQRLR